MPETSVREAATDYINRGWQVVPLAPNDKACKDNSWNSLVFTADDFDPEDNIGIRSVNGLVDIDCDAPEIETLAPHFLPPTEAIFGRHGKPRHYLYLSTFEKLVAYKDLAKTGEEAKKATMIEIRVNHQSMAPPSVHPEGGTIGWVKLGPAAPVEKDVLERAVRLLATAGLMARYYNPPGNRHDWGLAVAGLFKSLGMTEAETKVVFERAAEYAKDSEIKDRIGSVRATYNRGDDEPTKGAGGVKDLMGKGDLFIKSLQKIWGTGGGSFVLGDKDKILANSQENIKRALDQLNVKLAFNAFSQRATAKTKHYDGPLEDRIRNKVWLEIDRRFHFRPAPDFFDTVIQDVADENQIHPVRDYLRKLTWDKVPRVETWLIRAAKAADTEFVRTVSRIVLVAAVRRVMKPGCKFDELLVLESEQGKNKSSVLKALCPDVDWFSDDLPLNVDSKQIIERTTGKWIIEAQELSGMKKSNREHLKSMLSRQVDGPVRMAYARLPVSQPRQFVVIGTTNDHIYLTDPTGNRRIWPVAVEDFNVDMILRERDQLWAEATVLEAKGESIRLPEHLWEHAGLQQERRRTADPWEEKIVDLCGDQEVVRLAPDEIWMALGIPTERRHDQHATRIAAIMQRLKFRSMTVVNANGKRVRGWGRGTKPGTKSIFRDLQKEINESVNEIPDVPSDRDERGEDEF